MSHQQEQQACGGYAYPVDYGQKAAQEQRVTAAPAISIRAQIDAIDELISSLHSELDTLEAQLSPVMMPAGAIPTAPGGTGAALAVATTNDIASAARVQHERLQSVQQRLRDLNYRLKGML